jgi:hypothetical protein
VPQAQRGHIRGHLVITGELPLAERPLQDFAEALLRHRLDIDLVVDAPQEGFVR